MRGTGYSYNYREYDAIYFIRPTRMGTWVVVPVYEHGPYHDKRPDSWIGPYGGKHEAMLAAYDKTRGAL